MSTQPAVSARGLTKLFGDVAAVDGIDLEIHRGEVFGILGPNGAGKSTTMRMISCVAPPSAGTLRVLGRNPATEGPDIRERTGMVPQDNLLDQHLSVQQNLAVFGRYLGMSRAESRLRAARMLDFVQLTGRGDDDVQELSGGMKRRLAIARALMNDPQLVVLDEPTTGLDPQARHMLWERLFQLKQSGTTLLLATHYMDEAEQLCDRLVIMDGGRIVDTGTPRSLIDAHVAPTVVEIRFGTASPADYAGRLQDIGDRCEFLPDRLLVFAGDGDSVVAEIGRRQLTPSSVLVRRSTLEDVFLFRTGRRLVD